jgi:hypothetical protein
MRNGPDIPEGKQPSFLARDGGFLVGVMLFGREVMSGTFSGPLHDQKSRHRRVHGVGPRNKGPAMFNRQPAIGLTEAQAAEIKSQLVENSISGRR